jgi:hypothetical protein
LEDGDRLIVSSLDRNLFQKPDSLPIWLIQSPMIGFDHYYVMRGTK